MEVRGDIGMRELGHAGRAAALPAFLHYLDASCGTVAADCFAVFFPEFGILRDRQIAAQAARK